MVMVACVHWGGWMHGWMDLMSTADLTRPFNLPELVINPSVTHFRTGQGKITAHI